MFTRVGIGSNSLVYIESSDGGYIIMSKRGVNKVILVGNLGKDPEVKYLPNGNAVTNITVATSESYKDKTSGQDVDKTEWHRVVFFGKLAEIAGEYLTKGSQIYLEGKLQTRKWQDQSGQDKYTTEIVVDSFDGVMQMLGSKENGNAINAKQQPQQQSGGFKPQNQQQDPVGQIVNAVNTGNSQWIKKEWSSMIAKEWGGLDPDIQQKLNNFNNQ